jgi:hypothetical protein
MLNLRKVVIDYSVNELRSAYNKTYSDMEQELCNILVWSGHLALENIANSDALYHDLDHTVMVAMAGQAILEGKHLSEGGVTPRDWVHFMIALLCHDIGYVRGVCKRTRMGLFATGIGDEHNRDPLTLTDAALAPYHVDRSKLFVNERFGNNCFGHGNCHRCGVNSVLYRDDPLSLSLMTTWYEHTKGYRGLVRAADLIGQLGDPNRLRKCPALFYEFQEIGLNEKLGYKTPGDLRLNNAKFYWDVVSPTSRMLCDTCASPTRANSGSPPSRKRDGDLRATLFLRSS